MNTKIIAAGKEFDIGCRVIRWDEPEGMSFYQSKKYTGRNLSYEELSKKIDLFVLHHSVTYRAKMTYDVLLQRKLSVNFIIDDDNINGYATVFQCLDLKDAGWSHGTYNLRGPGVEISYQPGAWTHEGLYSEQLQKKYQVTAHEIVEDTIHGGKIKVFAPTQAQINSCIALLWGFCELFPNVRRSFPKDTEGNFIKNVIPNPTGLLNHYNLTKEKIDPAGFPHAKVEKKFQQRLQWGY